MKQLAYSELKEGDLVCVESDVFTVLFSKVVECHADGVVITLTEDIYMAFNDNASYFLIERGYFL